MDLSKVPKAWNLPEPWAVSEAGGGINNLTRFVTAGTQTYILRVYQNTSDRSRILYEHELLSRLQALGLSFAIPLPMPTHSGETFVQLEWGAVAALFHLIPGTIAEWANLEHAGLCGAAFGEVGLALTRIPVDFAPPPFRPVGGLEHIHPLVPQPELLPDSLDCPEEMREQLRAVFRELQQGLPPLYRTLPRQITHGDLSRGNVLIADGRVTGVLDFEFASVDLRLWDYASGLYTFALGARETGAEWELMAAFSLGYQRQHPLTVAEVEALPLFIRYQQAVSLIHWSGRARAGLAPSDAQSDRAARLLSICEWLAHHASRMVDSQQRYREQAIAGA